MANVSAGGYRRPVVGDKETGAGAQSSTGTARVVGRPFPKGVSGNPGGRPRSLVDVIRRQTRDGNELVDFFLEVLRDPAARLADRMAAGAWLADRGFGRPLQGEVYSVGRLNNPIFSVVHINLPDNGRGALGTPSPRDARSSSP
jgi:hypothetical protein